MTELRYCMNCKRERSATGAWQKRRTYWICPVCVSRIRKPTKPEKAKINANTTTK